jgi:RNA polymerase sigma-70 factor (ECF subfamily)
MGRVVDPSVEAELLARAKKGDGKAFEALVTPHYEPLIKMCQTLVYDRDLAGQCVQEALLRSWTKIDRCRDNFSGWFYRTAINVARDMRSEAFWRRSVPLPDDSDTVFSGPSVDTFEDVVIDQLEIIDVLARLRDNERELAVLHCIVGLDLKEAAEILDISHEAARKRWSRIVKTSRLM